MLKASCSWIHSDNGSFLNWHAGCIGYVKQRDGQWAVTLQTWGIYGVHPCASRRQGVRFLERWASSCKGFPGMGSVREARARIRREAARQEAASRRYCPLRLPWQHSAHELDPFCFKVSRLAIPSNAIVGRAVQRASGVSVGATLGATDEDAARNLSKHDVSEPHSIALRPPGH